MNKNLYRSVVLAVLTAAVAGCACPKSGIVIRKNYVSPDEIAAELQKMYDVCDSLGFCDTHEKIEAHDFGNLVDLIVWGEQESREMMYRRQRTELLRKVAELEKEVESMKKKAKE